MNAEEQLQFLFDHMNYPAAHVIWNLSDREVLDTMMVPVSAENQIEWFHYLNWGTDCSGNPIRGFKSFCLPRLGKFNVKRTVVLHWVEYSLIFAEATSGDVMLFIRDGETNMLYYVITYSAPLNLDGLLNLEGLTVNTVTQ